MAPDQASPSTTPAEPVDGSEEAPKTGERAPEPPPAVVGEVPAALLQLVLDDASERTGRPAGDLEVVVSEAHEWPDGALGCPEPGQFYTQAITPGYRVVLAVGDGSMLDYRLTARGSLRLCESALLTPPDH